MTSRSTPPNDAAVTRWDLAQLTLRRYFTPIVVASIAWVHVLCHLDPAGSYPDMPEGPGLTIDETFNVQQGVILVEAIRSYGIGLLAPDTLREVFSPPLHLPDHPPLGRLWLGVHHHLVWWLAPPEDPEGPFVTACARAGSATAFALTILMVGCCATAWYGGWAGLMASLGFAIMPRLLGHAHLAALESCTNLACTAATLAVASYWNPRTAPTSRVAMGTGIVLGLALLTKIQAVLIPMPIAFWAILRWRRFALRPLFIWIATACLVFFIGWPWLWLDPVGHLTQYLNGATNRAEISVWWLGQHFTDRTVPWYYAPVYFTWTLPLKLQLLFLLGCWGKPEEPIVDPEVKSPWLAYRLTAREVLLFLAAIWPVWFFALPRVSVYDCDRLWLPALPVLLVLFGRGTDVVLRRLQSWWKSGASLICYLFIGLTIVHLMVLSRIAPVNLSFYSATALGMYGVKQFDLERNYWGDAVTRSLLEDVVRRVPPETTIAMTPVLHQFQTEELWRQSPILRRHGVRLVPYESDDDDARYVLLFRRLADLPAEFRSENPEGWEVVSEVRFDGVQLAGLYRRLTQHDPQQASQPASTLSIATSPR